VSALCLHADTSLSGEKVAAALDKVVALRGAPESITVEKGAEFGSKAMDLWAYTNGVYLDFIRPGRPVVGIPITLYFDPLNCTVGG